MSTIPHPGRGPAADDGGHDPPFTTVFLGKTGAGKTSTLNALTGLDWPTDPVVACTTRPAVALLRQELRPGLNRPVHRLIDLPGVGESTDADRSYSPQYEVWARQADRLVYVTQADTRAYKQDQLILTRLIPLFKPELEFVLAVNQVDRLAGGDQPPAGTGWPGPTAEQFRHLAGRIDDVFEALAEVVGGAVTFRRADVISYAAALGWGLGGLRRLFYDS